MKKSTKKTKEHKFKKIQLFIVVSLLLVSVMMFFKTPGITGYVSADFRSQVLNLEIDHSQKLLLATTNPDPLYLTSFRVSGEITGDKSVEIFVDNNAGQRVLVYKNVKRKEQGLAPVTGMVIGAEADSANIETDPAKQEANLIILRPIGPLEWSQPETSLSAEEEYASGIFKNKCSDTCFIEMLLSSESAYELIFNIEPGAKLNINQITYTLKNGDEIKENIKEIE